MKLETINKIVIGSVVFLLAMYIGNLGVINFTKQECPTCKVEVIRIDSSPLENGGEIIIEVQGSNKTVYMSVEDLQFISKKRSKLKKIVEGINGLIARMDN